MRLMKNISVAGVFSLKKRQNNIKNDCLGVSFECLLHFRTIETIHTTFLLLENLKEMLTTYIINVDKQSK